MWQTKLGNKRMMKDESDKKWVMNHYIQGTSPFDIQADSD